MIGLGCCDSLYIFRNWSIKALVAKLLKNNCVCYKKNMLLYWAIINEIDFLWNKRCILKAFIFYRIRIAHFAIPFFIVSFNSEQKLAAISKKTSFEFSRSFRKEINKTGLPKIIFWRRILIYLRLFV